MNKNIVNIDPLTDERLSNIFQPTYLLKKSNHLFRDIIYSSNEKRILSISILGALSSWGHLTKEQIISIIQNFTETEIFLTLEDLNNTDVLNKFIDCPTCKNITIYGLKPSKALKKIVSSMSSHEAIYAFAEQNPDPKNIYDLCSTAQTNKHDISIAELSRRIALLFDNTVALGAKYTSCSSLLRNTKPDGAMPWATRSIEIERWADSLIVFFNNNTRYALEMGLKQSVNQIARKARWWGMSIAYRGGYEKCGLRVVFVDPPEKPGHSKKAIEQSFFKDESWIDIVGQKNVLESLCYVNWSDWIVGEESPFFANGMVVTDGLGNKIKLANEKWEHNWTSGLETSIKFGLISGIFKNNMSKI